MSTFGAKQANERLPNDTATQNGGDSGAGAGQLNDAFPINESPNKAHPNDILISGNGPKYLEIHATQGRRRRSSAAIDAELNLGRMIQSPASTVAADGDFDRRSVSSRVSYYSRLNADAALQAISAQPMVPLVATPLVEAAAPSGADAAIETPYLSRRTVSGGVEKSEQQQTVDTVLESINDKSDLAQALVFGISLLSAILLSVSSYAQGFFLMGRMDYICTSTASSSSTPEDDHQTTTTPMPVDFVVNQTADHCYVPGTSGERCTAWNYSSPYYVQTMRSEWNLVCQHAYKISLFQSCLYFGTTVGVILCGRLADRYGRHRIMMFTTPISFACNVAMALMPEYGIPILILRFITGFSLDADYQAKFILVLEICNLRRRTVYGPLMRSAWPGGMMLSALVGYLCQNQDWRYLQWVCVVLSIPCLFLTLLLPESPRWLNAVANQKVVDNGGTVDTDKSYKLAAGRLKKAVKVLQRMACINRAKINTELWSSLLMPPTTRRRSIITANNSKEEKSPTTAMMPLRRRSSTAAAAANNNSSTTARTIPATPQSPVRSVQNSGPSNTRSNTTDDINPIGVCSGTICRTLWLVIFVQSMLSISWNGNAFYATGILPGSPYITMACLSLAQMLACFSLVYVIEWCGSTRRTILLLMAVSAVVEAGLTAILIVVSNTDVDGTSDLVLGVPRATFNYVYVLFSVMFSCTTAMASSTDYIYTGEICPIHIRQTGVGLVSGLSNGVGASSPFVANLFGTIWRPLPALLFASCCACGFVTATFLPKPPAAIAAAAAAAAAADSDSSKQVVVVHSVRTSVSKEVAGDDHDAERQLLTMTPVSQVDKDDHDDERK